MEKQILQLRVFLWSLLILILIWFAWMKIIPTGHIIYKTKIFGNDFFIGKLSPTERVEGKNKIIGDPVYFSLSTPRRFDRAQVELEYENNSSQDLIEFGVLVGEKNWNYRLEPVENRVIDNLEDWNKISEADLTLLQRKKNYDNIKSFLENPPARDKIALYNTKLEDEYLLDDYQAGNHIYNFDKVLRGRYAFYTYIKDESLAFDFRFQDLNEDKDTDEVTIDLYYNNQVIDSWHLDDDGVVIDNGHWSEERNLSLELKNLPEGVYKIEVNTGDDILTKNIATKQTKMAFVGTFRLAKNNKTNQTLFTDGQELFVKTLNPDSLQTILIDDKELIINETYKQFSTNLSSINISQVKIEKDGLILASDGVITFSKEALLNPGFKKVDGNLDTNRVDYILANYRSPEIIDGAKKVNLDIDLSDAYREDSKYSFIISIPGLSIEDGKDVKIKSIKINLFGKSLLEKIKEFF